MQPGTTFTNDFCRRVSDRNIYYRCFATVRKKKTSYVKVVLGKEKAHRLRGGVRQNYTRA